MRSCTVYLLHTGDVFLSALYPHYISNPPPAPSSLLILQAIEFKDWPPGGKNPLCDLYDYNIKVKKSDKII